MPEAGGAGGVRIGLAVGEDSLEPTPDWVYLTETPNLVASYSIDRGRVYETDKNDTGTAVVQINDPHGILDPTNTTGPYAGLLEPLLQVQIELLDPIADVWHTRFRGFVEDFAYGIHPTQQLGQLQLNLVDIFAILTAIEMQPVPSASDGLLAAFGEDLHSQQTNGQIYFVDNLAQTRALNVLGNAGIPVEWYVIFELNVYMLPSTYAPSENVLQVLQDVADAEFPMVGELLCDRFGRACIRGRLARFDPHGTWLGIGASDPVRNAKWALRDWVVGDGAAVAAAPTTTAQIRQLAFDRGLSKVINSAYCTPNEMRAQDLWQQYDSDQVSIGLRGWRSWSAENLFVDHGTLTGYTGPQECLAFAQYIVANYATPRDRVSLLGFRSMHPSWLGAAATWDLLTAVDIGDTLTLTETTPGGGGFVAEPFFVEGVHEAVQPLNPEMADVTLTLDVSPQAYFPPDSPLRGPH